MKRSYQLALVLGAAGVAAVGFSFGYLLHIRQEIDRFAKESDRTSSNYDFEWVWIRPTDGSIPRPAVLARPSEDSHATRAAATRWRWDPEPDASEPCTAEEHRLIWRVKPDRWEILSDLEADRSVPPYPDAEASD